MPAITTPRAPRAVHGVLLLDKPTGITSNRALQQAKRLFGAAKAGHAGSLDPLATGMLPICFGEATKLTGLMLGGDKVYRVTALLGVATDTGDSDGRIVSEKAAPEPSIETLREVLVRFTGDIVQIPPMFSALKHEGQRLYALARQGIDVAREPRPISIREIVLEGHRGSELELRVRCSKGTYIRTLVEDIAESLGTVGHVRALRRLAVAPFQAQGMTTLEELEKLRAAGPEHLASKLLPVDSPIEAWPVLRVTEPLTAQLAQGQAVPAEPSWPRGRVRLYAPASGFFGIGEVSMEGRLMPRRMFPALLEPKRR